MNDLNKRITNLSPAKRAFLERRLQGKMAGIEDKSIIPQKTKQELGPLAFRRDGEGTPLFLFHYLTPSQVLAKYLGPGRPVYGIDSTFDEQMYLWQESGRVGTSVEELAEACRAEVQHTQCQGAYLLAGFCFGGVLAFEVARQLKKRGERVAFLGLLDSFYLPGLKSMSMPWLKVDTEQKSVKTEEERGLLCRIAFMRELIKTYKSEPYPGNAVLFRAMAGREPSDHDANGWKDVFVEGVEVENCDCSRMGLFEQPFVVDLATRLTAHLSRAEARFGKSDEVNQPPLPVPDQASPEAEKAFVAPRTEKEELLADIWSQVLRLERISVHDTFFELGGDSIRGIQVIAKANQLGLRLTLRQIFQHPTIADLALVAETATPTRVEHSLISGDVPLTPIQKWFFEQGYSDYHHWNQAKLLELKEVLNPALLEKAIQDVVAHHDALRLRFVREAQKWKQLNAGSQQNVKLRLVNLEGMPEHEQAAVLENAAAELQASLNPSQGPIVRVALFNFGPQRPARLLFVIHHLAVDGVSWRILFEDLQTCYQQLQDGGMAKLPAKTTSFKQWAKQLSELAHSGAFEKEANYWLAVCRAASGALPMDLSGGENGEATARTVSVTLDAAETRALLKQVPQAYNTQINDVLLSALGLALLPWIRQPTVQINLEGHGREDICEGVDLSRTVGWFTTIFPVNLELGGLVGQGSVMKAVKEQLRRIPHHGIGYGILRYLVGGDTVAAELRTRPQPQLLFNYLGQSGEPAGTPLWREVEGSTGPTHSPRARRSHLVEINSWVADGQLRVHWRYSEAMHRRSTIDRLAQDFLKELRSLIHHCTSPGVGGYTPSDFAEAGLDQEKLDALLAELGEPAS